MLLAPLIFAFLQPSREWDNNNKMRILSIQQAQQIYDRLVQTPSTKEEAENTLLAIGFHINDRGFVSRVEKHNPDWHHTDTFMVQSGKELTYGDDLDNQGYPNHFQILERDVLETFCRMYFPNQMVILVKGDDFLTFYDIIKDIPGVHPPVYSGASTEWIPVVVAKEKLFRQITHRFDKMSEIYIYWFNDNVLEASWD